MSVYNKPHSTRLLLIHKLLKDLNIESLKYCKIEYLSSGEKRKISLATNVGLTKMLECQVNCKNISAIVGPFDFILRRTYH